MARRMLCRYLRRISTAPTISRRFSPQAYRRRRRLRRAARPIRAFASALAATMATRSSAIAKLGPPMLPCDAGAAARVELQPALCRSSRWQGSGVAQALMDWTIATARARGADDAVCSASSSTITARRRFYERYGFVEIGDYDFMVGDQIDDGPDHAAGAVTRRGRSAPARSTACRTAFSGGAAASRPGCYAGLNVGLGSDDDPAAIAENRRRAAEAVLPGAQLVTVYQVHSADAVAVIEPFADRRSPACRRARHRPARARCSASSPPIARRCCSPTRRRAWSARRMPAGRARSAASPMRRSRRWRRSARERDRIAAAIGPCIARASYEVDDGFVAPLRRGRPGERALLRRRPRRPPPVRSGGLCRRTASPPRASTRVEALGLDTYADEDALLQLPPRDPPRRAGLRPADRADRHRTETALLG